LADLKNIQEIKNAFRKSKDDPQLGPENYLLRNFSRAFQDKKHQNQLQYFLEKVRVGKKNFHRPKKKGGRYCQGKSKDFHQRKI